MMRTPKPTAPIYDPLRFLPITTVDLNGPNPIADILCPEVCEILWVRDGVIDLWTEYDSNLWRVFILDHKGHILPWAGAESDLPPPFMPARTDPLPWLKRLIAHTATGMPDGADLGILLAYNGTTRPTRYQGHWSLEGQGVFSPPAGL